MRKLWFPIVCFVILANSAWADDKPTVIDVWPGKAPGETTDLGEEKILDDPKGKSTVKRLTNISKPTLSIYRPAKEKNTGAAIVIAPGGGYSILAWDLEGEEVAQWLNSIGVTGIVLKYRVPRRADQPKDKPPLGALQDAQRSMSIVRSHAEEWGIDPKRIGMLGFSAGGHLTAWTATQYDKRSYEALDGIDKVSCRPDFAVLVYPGGLIAKDTLELNPEIRVTKDTPSCFFAHATNDAGKSENSIAMYLALKKVGVSAEMHLYATGGHGFGLRPSTKPCSTWPQRCSEWMTSQGYLKAASTK